VRTGAGNGREWKGEEDSGGRKGKAGGKGEHGESKDKELKERSGMEGINLSHGRLKTLAAL